MLKLRICPSCGTESRSVVAYFCRSCGRRLPDAVQKREEAGAQEKKKSRGKLKGLNLSKFVRLFLVVLSGAVGIAILVNISVRYLSNKIQPEIPASGSQRNQLVRKDVFLDIEEFSFGEKGIYTVVPQDVDYYLESKNPEKVLPYILNESEQKLLKDLLLIDLSEAASYLGETFVLIERKKTFSFISEIKDIDFVENKISGLGEIESWQAVIVGNFLVVSNSSALGGDIEKAFKKQILSLGLSSEFLSVLAALPESGQFFVYIPTRIKKDTHLVIEDERLELIPDTLRGVGFVAKKDLEGTKIIGEEDE